jgi:hypothetical protein
MADKKITELPVASTPSGPELFEIVQGGVNKQTTITAILGITPENFIQDVVDTTGDTITLDFESKIYGNFSGSATFAAPREVVRTNQTNALKFDFMFEVTDVDVPIDFGADTRSTSALFVDGVFTPQDVGLYKVTGTRYGPGGNWILDFRGVYSVGDAPPTPADQWVLSTGIWNDSEFWDNDAIWRNLP